jgi:hypothetical protein
MYLDYWLKGKVTLVEPVRTGNGDAAMLTIQIHLLMRWFRTILLHINPFDSPQFMDLLIFYLNCPSAEIVN